jgi:hypothetical protein
MLPGHANSLEPRRNIDAVAPLITVGLLADVAHMHAAAERSATAAWLRGFSSSGPAFSVSLKSRFVKILNSAPGRSPGSGRFGPFAKPPVYDRYLRNAARRNRR